MGTKPSIFIAHSTLDTREARIIRNLFEEREHDALMLKLAQNMTQDFLENLIQKEIQARDWLVVADSPNAQQSRWVPFEQAYARLRGKRVFRIDLAICSGNSVEQDLVDCLAAQVARISRDLRVFISYSSRDNAMAEKMRHDLQQEGYEAWLDTQIRAGENWRNAIEDALKATLEKGYVIVLVSENAASSLGVQTEIDYAQVHQGRIIPCLIDPRPTTLPHTLARMQYIDFTDKSYPQAFQKLIRVLQ